MLRPIVLTNVARRALRDLGRRVGWSEGSGYGLGWLPYDKALPLLERLLKAGYVRTSGEKPHRIFTLSDEGREIGLERIETGMTYSVRVGYGIRT